MQLLKAVTILMGVLIFVGLGVIGFTIANRTGGAGKGRPVTARLDLPPGAAVRESFADGGRLVVRLDLPGGGTRFLLVDLGSGASLGQIDLGSAP